jgi:predicted MPP superfamily phosphohydrolase
MDGTRRSKRRIGCAVVLLLTALTTGWLASVAWHEAKADPIVRRTTLTLPGMPSGTQPVTIALLSDIHVAEPDMPPARLKRIVAQVNALHPDVLVLAGDFVSAPGAFIHPYPIATAIAPLAGHTHCGQIRLFGWAPMTNSRFGQRYACGIVRERGNELIVTAGRGTSVVPLRLGAPPDLWLIEIRPR